MIASDLEVGESEGRKFIRLKLGTHSAKAWLYPQREVFTSRGLVKIDEDWLTPDLEVVITPEDPFGKAYAGEYLLSGYIQSNALADLLWKVERGEIGLGKIDQEVQVDNLIIR